MQIVKNTTILFDPLLFYQLSHGGINTKKKESLLYE